MATNVSIEYANAEKKYHDAKTPEDKLTALLEMRSTVPSHKGCEAMRREISKKIAELKSTIERQKNAVAKKGSSSASMYVKKEGVGQVVLIGGPNVGKSFILNKLVGKDIAQVTPYPFATTEPVPAMMDYDGASVQLVELPAIIEGSSEGKAQGKEIIGMVRNADAVVIVASSKEEGKVIVDELAKSNVYLNKTKPPIDVKSSSFPGIQISGKEYLKFGVEQLEQYLKNTGYSNSNVIITGTINSLSEVAQALNERIVYKKAIAINSWEYSEHKAVDWKCQIFLLLDAILVYTKKPNQTLEQTEPLSLPKGSTVFDVAKHLHKDFASKLKFARVWGSTKFDGQRVGPEYELKNKDIIEINI
ncbi:MAG: TGS domain-containing protein [Candidatus Diapherotrites archaeon]|uniref:TGS domain-containing protein n=1 Tax=Candidatus Iainarchaeum sp. TaxID=3101447 RepID=A0A7K4BYH5_9ARCH|nr:TGS domain-containing protein [Candidatus Diapherotrites archaeon]